MSNPLAIAAVTATLQQMLSNSTSGVGANLPSQLPSSLNLNSISVTTRPPDKARQANDTSNQLNLFLYQTAPNAAWRNMDMPRQTAPGEISMPPVALTLHYLLSAYPSTDDDTAAHILLGQAMRIFNDHAILNQNDIRNALPGNDLYEQVDRVRITPQTFSVEEISKLWTAFATNYRVSAAYEVSVVLIESSKPAKTPQPVLSRGSHDRGVPALVGANLPILEEVVMPYQQSSAVLGDQPILTGQNFTGFSSVSFTLASPLLPDFPPISMTPPAVQLTDQGITINLPSAALPADAAARAAWIPGFYSVAVVVNRTIDGQQQTWSSNKLPFMLAPLIETIEQNNASLPAGNVVTPDSSGNVTLTLTCSPSVALATLDPLTDTQNMRFGQQVLLLLVPLVGAAARQIAPQPPPGPPAAPATPPTSTNQLVFQFPVTAAEAGDYWVRLRVDGVDLALVDRTVRPPQFDASQKITIQ
jgi:hypothetical protein